MFHYSEAQNLFCDAQNLFDDGWSGTQARGSNSSSSTETPRATRELVSSLLAKARTLFYQVQKLFHMTGSKPVSLQVEAQNLCHGMRLKTCFITWQMERYASPWQQLKFLYGNAKGKAFTEEEDRFIVCMCNHLGSSFPAPFSDNPRPFL